MPTQPGRIGWSGGVPVDDRSGAASPNDHAPLRANLNSVREALEQEALRWRSESRQLTSDLVARDAEIYRLQAALSEAEGRLVTADRRYENQCLQSQEVAHRCSIFTTRFQQQAQLNGKLRQVVEVCEAETEDLRKKMLEIRHGESGWFLRVAERDVSVRKLQESLASVPGAVRQEVDAAVQQVRETTAAEIVREANSRIEGLEHSLQCELSGKDRFINCTRAEHANIGRQCQLLRTEYRSAEDATRLWQQQYAAANARAQRCVQREAGLEALAQTEELRAANNWAHGEQLEAKLARVTKQWTDSDAVGKELRDWVVKSVNEVNRSAHGPRDPFAPDEAGFAGRTWSDILSSFGEAQRLRIGHGSRTR